MAVELYEIKEWRIKISEHKLENSIIYFMYTALEILNKIAPPPNFPNEAQHNWQQVEAKLNLRVVVKCERQASLRRLVDSCYGLPELDVRSAYVTASTKKAIPDILI